jgi:transcriptional regulator with XRE-family HTH domain
LMPFCTALSEVRSEKGLSAAAVARMGLVSQSMIRQVEAGTKRFATDVVIRLVRALGEPQLLLEAAREVTGGAFVSPWLDGDRVDLHRCSVAAKLREELKEGSGALETFDLANVPRKDEYTKRQAEAVVLQLIDCRVAIDHFTAVVARDFGLDVFDVFAKHDRKLLDHGLIKRRPA